MVITISVMPLFTYPSILLCSHRVITIICDLQIFSCPSIGDVTHVHCAATLETETSGALMTFSAICHCLEASCSEVTFGMIHHVKSPPSDPAPP
jgi:hypothetical protein